MIYNLGLGCTNGRSIVTFPPKNGRLRRFLIFGRLHELLRLLAPSDRRALSLQPPAVPVRGRSNNHRLHGAAREVKAHASVLLCRVTKATVGSCALPASVRRWFWETTKKPPLHQLLRVLAATAAALAITGRLAISLVLIIIP